MQVLSEWGAAGAQSLAAQAAVAIVVDVLSFSTCVDVATSRGASVIPFAYGDPGSARAAAIAAGAEMAGRRRDPHARYSLSPGTLFGLKAGATLLLPSPNGATISAAAAAATGPTLAGCLRNAAAVAAKARALAAGGPIAVIPAGERWPDGGLRPAIEDLIGAGAVIDGLEGARAPEADIAHAAFLAARDDLAGMLAASTSGQELIAMGFAQDVGIASALDVSQTAPLLTDGVYVDAR